MRSVVVFLCLLGVVCASGRAVYEFVEEWELWKDSHGKGYRSELVELEKHLVWLSNKKYIEQHNANSHIFGFTLAMNHFGDMTDLEFAERYLTYQPSSAVEQRRGGGGGGGGGGGRGGVRASTMKVTVFTPPDNVKWPEAMDWRTRNAVTEVKDQANCGASYAFSTTGSLEGAYALAYGRLSSLSEQNLIDCSVPEGNTGCHGGNMYNSFMYIVFNDGIERERNYHYQGMQMPCNFTSGGVGATMSGVVTIPMGSEYDLMAAVSYAGPVSVAVDASSTSFRFYSSGVYDSVRCSSYNVNHAMLTTGYGKHSESHDYWIVKNSWGPNWGVSGFIFMSRGRYNQCGIATDALYPSL